MHNLGSMPITLANLLTRLPSRFLFFVSLNGCGFCVTCVTDALAWLLVRREPVTQTKKFCVTFAVLALQLLRILRYRQVVCWQESRGVQFLADEPSRGHTSPVRVEYELTDRGQELELAVRVISAWAEKWLP